MAWRAGAGLFPVCCVQGVTWCSQGRPPSGGDPMAPRTVPTHRSKPRPLHPPCPGERKRSPWANLGAVPPVKEGGLLRRDEACLPAAPSRRRRVAPARGQCGAEPADLWTVSLHRGPWATWKLLCGGGGGVGEMGFRVGPFVLCKNGCWRRRRRNTKFWPAKVFSANNPPPPPPHLSSQNDQRDVCIILSHRCWVDPPPPLARQVGHPRPEPPLPSRRPRRGGVGKMGLRVPPPPRQSNFLPALLDSWVPAALPHCQKGSQRGFPREVRPHPPTTGPSPGPVPCRSIARGPPHPQF